MPPRSLRTAVLSFGLVTIPVRFYTATSSEAPHFHLVHEKCGTRIKQQLMCPSCDRVVERDELVRAYELGGHSARGNDYVTFTQKELEALESAASPTLDITEFVPLPAIDPVYFETTYYLGPDKAGEKAFALLVTAMTDAELAAVVQFVWREKENIAAIRAVDGNLILHTLFFADEVRTLRDITPGRQKVDASQVRLARKLVEELRTERFDPNKYKDVYRARLQAAARQKAKGKSLALEAPTKKKEQVVDLMEALQASLGRKAQDGGGRRRTRTQTSLGGRSRRRNAA